MRSVIYSMNMSLDGYIVGPDGDLNWSEPDRALFQMVTDEMRSVGVHLLGRRLYETMLYWETAEDDPALDFSTAEWAQVWKALPKLVFSTTLTEVEGNAQLATSSLSVEIERLRAKPDAGAISIGGATLATQAATLGLIDEYRIRTHPILVGGGIRYFPHDGNRQKLELVETRTFDSGVICTRYRVLR